MDDDDSEVFELRMQLLDKESQIRKLSERLLQQQDLIVQLQTTLMESSMLDENVERVPPIVIAAKLGNVDSIEAMLGPEPVDVPAGAGVERRDQDVLDDALLSACMNGHVEAARLLIKHGANVHVDYDSPLIWACRRSCTDPDAAEQLVRLLINSGANMRTLNDYPLRHATQHHNVELIRELVTHGAESCSSFVSK